MKRDLEGPCEERLGGTVLREAWRDCVKRNLEGLCEERLGGTV